MALQNVNYPPVVTSAIAAILLAGGNMAQLTFGISHQLFASSSYNITGKSAAGKMPKAAEVIIGTRLLWLMKLHQNVLIGS